jgi:hypothetical protein
MVGDRLLLFGDGTLSFFEYVGIRKLKRVVAGGAERERLTGIEQAMRSVRDRCQFDRDCVLANVPPAWVHHLRFGEPPPPKPPLSTRMFVAPGSLAEPETTPEN